MHKPHPPIYDVVIAGAGPVGLFLACELRLQDLSVLVLERAEDPHSPLKRLPFGMRGLSAPTLEAFYRRGLLDELVAAQHANDDAGKTAAAAHWLQQPRRPAGHFAGIQFYHDDVDTSKWPYRLPSPADTSMAVTLETLETVLARRASAMGAEIRRGVSVDGFLASDADVAVHAGGETFHGRWLVGCDGGRSSIRKAGGFEFVGTDPEFTGYSVEVEVADPQALRPGRHYTPAGMYTYARAGTIAMVEFDGGAFHRIQPITLEHVQAVLRRVSGTDVTLTGLLLATTWTDRACQATAYCKGRVLLAGDAAHIHLPVGGQGMSAGVQDAVNLGWKLAAVLNGAAPDLLDTYEEERRPVAAAMLGLSTALLDAAQRGDMRRGRATQQLGLGYPGSPLALAGPVRPGVMAGDRAPDARVRGAAGQPVRLFALFAGVHWTLLAQDPSADVLDALRRPGLHIHAFGAGGDLVDADGCFREGYRLAPGELALVRPDGYLAAVASCAAVDALDALLRRVGADLLTCRTPRPCPSA